MSQNETLKFKVHTSNLISEIMSNPSAGILHKPLIVFKDLLIQVAIRASELNDVELNKLMMQLALYEISDPESKEYDPEFVNNYLNSESEEK